MNKNSTPRSERLHIAFFGKRNSGKSSLLNAVIGQNVSIVSSVLGTTTDPVYKTSEIFPLGPCVFIDTAGFDDEGDLGKLRTKKTEEVVLKTDVALIVLPANSKDFSAELTWLKKLKSNNIKTIAVVNKIDLTNDEHKLTNYIKKTFKVPVAATDALNKVGINNLLRLIIENAPQDFSNKSIVGNLVKPGNSVLLVMPQDSEAPKGRIILPQVQTIRELLDKKAIITCVAPEEFESALNTFKKPPSLIITDSKEFKKVYEKAPKESVLTSFSILFANYKGDINTFLEGAKAIDNLDNNSRVLIAEACTHNIQDEDIARVKIPALLKKTAGEGICVEFATGSDFLKGQNSYDLVIHCGGCMFNRAHILSRIALCKEKNIPITNYGVAIAHMTGILNLITTTN